VDIKDKLENIPDDMNHPELAKKMNASAVVSIRDLLILLDDSKKEQNKENKDV